MTQTIESANYHLPLAESITTPLNHNENYYLYTRYIKPVFRLLVNCCVTGLNGTIISLIGSMLVLAFSSKIDISHNVLLGFTIGLIIGAFGGTIVCIVEIISRLGGPTTTHYSNHWENTIGNSNIHNNNGNQFIVKTITMYEKRFIVWYLIELARFILAPITFTSGLAKHKWIVVEITNDNNNNNNLYGVINYLPQAGYSIYGWDNCIYYSLYDDLKVANDNASTFVIGNNKVKQSKIRKFDKNQTVTINQIIENVNQHKDKYYHFLDWNCTDLSKAVLNYNYN